MLTFKRIISFWAIIANYTAWSLNNWIFRLFKYQLLVVLSFVILIKESWTKETRIIWNSFTAESF